MTFPLHIEYTADWDGDWLSVVAEVTDTVSGGAGGLRSSAVLDPTRCKTVGQARVLLLKNEYVPEDDVVRGRFKVRKM